MKKFRLAFVVSHPIQYYAPIYRQLAGRPDVEVKVFFTWHAGGDAVHDSGFKRPVAWDVPLTSDYDFELLRNVAADPGSHHLFGVRNPGIIGRLMDWKPDAVHVTGYTLASHLWCIIVLAHRGIPTIFRGDSHILEQGSHRGWRLKRAVRRFVFRRPSIFLYVGTHNRAYYRDAGVPDRKLVFSPHSIDVDRFARPDDQWEQQAATWRHELGIPTDHKVVLFAGKFEPKKRPLELIGAMKKLESDDIHLLMVGDGELAEQVRARAREHPGRVHVLPFQNQSRMPVLLRAADVFCLPSAYAETWGLGVNEALACGRPAVVSTRVGCACDVIRPGFNGEVFQWDDWDDFHRRLSSTLSVGGCASPSAIREDAKRFSTDVAVATLMGAIRRLAGSHEE
jgi:glycosyltransferase involved in cell wall biosynthesis